MGRERKERDGCFPIFLGVLGIIGACTVLENSDRISKIEGRLENPQAVYVETKDFNRDGYEDVAVTMGDGKQYFFMNNGQFTENGQYTPLSEFDDKTRAIIEADIQRYNEGEGE